MESWARVAAPNLGTLDTQADMAVMIPQTVNLVCWPMYIYFCTSMIFKIPHLGRSLSLPRAVSGLHFLTGRGTGVQALEHHVLDQWSSLLTEHYSLSSVLPPWAIGPQLQPQHWLCAGP